VLDTAAGEEVVGAVAFSFRLSPLGIACVDNACVVDTRICATDADCVGPPFCIGITCVCAANACVLRTACEIDADCGPGPHFEVAAGGASRPAPGWSTRVRPTTAARYAGPAAALRAGLAPLMPHEDLAFRSVSSGSLPTPLAHVGIVAIPNDLEEGLPFVGLTADGREIEELAAPREGIVTLRADGDRGMIPGEPYELGFPGALALGIPGAPAPTQAESGSYLETWGAASLTREVAYLGARYAFETHPVRIESPGEDGFLSLATLTTSGTASGINVQVIVRAGHPRVASASRLRVSLMGGATEIDFADVPFIATGPTVRLSQGGVEFDVYQRTVFVPIAATTAYAGIPNGTIVARLDTTVVPALDQIEARFDFTRPTVPGPSLFGDGAGRHGLPADRGRR